ncbi:MAG TPA: hypothetical protein VGH33_20365 [Isosphaeraceae bacterium]
MDTNQPPPSLGDIASGVRRLASHWVARVWDGPLGRRLLVGAACVLAVFLLWPQGPGQRDLEAARLRTEQAAIRGILDRDKAIGQEAARKVGILDRYWDGSGLVYEIAATMDALDLTGCPRDFQVAYKKHVSAWGALATVKAGNEGFAGAIKGFFTAGLAIVPAMSEMDRAMNEVRTTWSEVQQAAIQHGVAP